MPVGGLTGQQLKAVQRIEQDICAPDNAFGLDSQASSAEHDFLESLQNIFPTCPACGDKLQFDRQAALTVKGSFGLHICDDDSVNHLVNYGKSFNRQTENRDAQVVEVRSVVGGWVEVLAYEKWGHMNLNLRFTDKQSEDSETTTQQSQVFLEDSENVTVFEELEKRFFRCQSCGGTTRLSKFDYGKYRDGETIEMNCDCCGSFGEVSLS